MAHHVGPGITSRAGAPVGKPTALIESGSSTADGLLREHASRSLPSTGPAEAWPSVKTRR